MIEPFPRRIHTYSYHKEKGPAFDRASNPIGNADFLVAGSLSDQVIDDAVRFVDVMDGAIPQTPYRGIILFAGDVVVGSIQQFHCAMEAAGAIHSGIDRRMIAQVLAIPNRSSLDFIDSFVDLFNGMAFFFVHVISRSHVFQVGAGVPQVGEGVQVSRMPSRFVGKGQSGAGGDK
jgi:hypothetical protein